MGAAPAIVVGTRTARVSRTEAARVLDRVRHLTAVEALFALRFAAGTICPQVARVLQDAMAVADRTLEPGGYVLVISAYTVDAGDPVTRVRRLAHGSADWITTQTTAITIELSPLPNAVRKD
ncbi:uL22 family ribosomal protein [Dactylosporangium sp. CA-092794]|uniref:uL22 family ribosomal protein n=1 Tax=Dactylosporangium sp. CA-092794 TaxID=3239929 RepID=UPI003D8E1A2B